MGEAWGGRVLKLDAMQINLFMKKHTTLTLILFSILLLVGCTNFRTAKVSPNEPISAKAEAPPQKKQRPSALANGKFFEKDGRKYLYGGEREEQHFDITGYTLKDGQFHYGIGRERFPALLEPTFISVKEAATLWQDEDRFLLAKLGNETKAYSIKDLTHHEVVNDVIGGKPVFAAYCILADLGAMYDRVIGGKEYTFALSGYTYFDPAIWDGLDGFVMWDRETESLWWPLTGKAV